MAGRGEMGLSSISTSHQLVPEIELIPLDVEIKQECESKIAIVLTTSLQKRPEFPSQLYYPVGKAV